jgi:spore germination cell wall hydrolase CwlJ-like protein
MRLNSNWSIEGQYTNFAKDLFMNTSIAADGTKTTKEDALSGKSFGVTGLYHFNPQGSYSPFVKLGWHHWSFKNKENVSASGNHEFYGVGLDGLKLFQKKVNGKLLMKTTNKPHLLV